MKATDPLLPRVLIVRVGAMGDVLHTLPGVAALRTQWPEAAIDWVVDERWAPLLSEKRGAGPVVTQVHTAPTRLWSRAPFSRETRRSIVALRRTLRGGGYDVVVDAQGTLRSAVISRFAGSPERWGFRDPRERLATVFYRRFATRAGTHVVEQNAALLSAAVGLELAPAEAELPRHPEGERWARQALPDGQSPAVLLAPTAGWGAKQWPATSFAALARVLAGRGWTVLVNASAPQESVPLAVLGGAGATALNSIRVVSPALEGLLELTRRVQVVVGGDSGPVHLAAALGTPTVALFGPTDPARNGPWGAGATVTLRSPLSVTNYKRLRTTEGGLASLSVDEVVLAIDQVQQRASAKM